MKCARKTTVSMVFFSPKPVTALLLNRAAIKAGPLLCGREVNDGCRRKLKGMDKRDQRFCVIGRGVEVYRHLFAKRNTL